MRECLQTQPEVVDSDLRLAMQKLQEEENDIMRQFLLTAHLKGNQPIPATLLTHQLLHPVGIIRELMQNPRWSSISVSLHHYDTGALQVLYGLKHEVEMPVLAGIDVSKVNAVCNLVRDFGAPIG